MLGGGRGKRGRALRGYNCTGYDETGTIIYRLCAGRLWASGCDEFWRYLTRSLTEYSGDDAISQHRS
ncbi:hypothetical protein VZT92_022929 [Zoarces viviparus]|uniref:Uncharacterized protein n=1 Tax=Zoarces viviparus TaxID=48416 RepID=A0AAW1E5S8_ZOAVI